MTLSIRIKRSHLSLEKEDYKPVTAKRSRMLYLIRLRSSVEFTLPNADARLELAF